uniref:Ig-like domain-containing protein n=1 Tax=Seriola lalandi dorsalis TaxID=1841481 RepID=A0A3B4WV36_SERLL
VAVLTLQTYKLSLFDFVSPDEISYGEDVTLPCKNVADDQGECGNITWTFTGLTTSDPVELILHGRISEKVKDRMSLTEKCSLVIKKVTAGDGGQYYCQSRSGQIQRYLFVIDSEYLHHVLRYIYYITIMTSDEVNFSLVFLSQCLRLHQ